MELNSRLRCATGSLLVLLALWAVTGCGGGVTVPVRSSFVEFTPDQRTEIETNARRPYRVQTDDVLRVAISHQKELLQDGLLVLPDGSVSLLGAGNLQVAGLTLAEADSAITAAYSRELRDPRFPSSFWRQRASEYTSSARSWSPDCIRCPGVDSGWSEPSRWRAVSLTMQHPKAVCWSGFRMTGIWSKKSTWSTSMMSDRSPWLRLACRPTTSFTSRSRARVISVTSHAMCWRA